MCLSFIQITIFVSYITFLVIKFGVLPSISESWYQLRDLGGVWYSLFSWFCFGLGFTMFFQTNGDVPYLFFLSGAGLSMIGVLTMFKLKNDIQPYIHFVGCFISVVCGFFGIGIERHTWIPLIGFLIISTLLNFILKKNKMWWWEILAFTSIILGLLLTK